MRRVQVPLGEEDITELEREASAAGVSVAALVRQLIETWVKERQRSERINRALAAVRRGGGHSGLTDLAENHDKYLWDPDED